MILVIEFMALFTVVSTPRGLFGNRKRGLAR